MQKYKIQVILRNSPQKQSIFQHNSAMGHNYNHNLSHNMNPHVLHGPQPSQPSHNSQNQKYKPNQPFPQNYNQGVLYSRTAASSLNIHDLQQNVINLRQKIVNRKQSFIRPSSQKQKQRQSKMFTQKCLDILSKKKNIGRLTQHQSRMHAMMSHVVDKYRKVISNSKAESHHHNGSSNGNGKKGNIDRTLTQPKTLAGYSQLNGFQDKIQIYRMIKSTQISKSGKQQNSNSNFNTNTNTNTKQQKNKQILLFDWRSKPDVTGIRVNNRILKSQSYNIRGVECFSLSISQSPATKRNSLISNQVITAVPISNTNAQTRTISSNSSRKKVTINQRHLSQKFMAFSMNSDTDALYMKKLKSFLDFLFKINYSNKVYVSLQLSQDTVNIRRYKVYIGKGNNSLLIKSLLKRRFWLQIVQNIQQQGINFYWTQNKINKVHYKQRLSKVSKFRQLMRQKQLKEKEKDKEKQGGSANLGTGTNVKRKQNIKDPEQRQLVELNKKILPGDECYQVQNYICKDGYYIPTEKQREKQKQKQKQEKYTCNLITNHIPRNTSIGSKKNLFKSLFHYYKQYIKTDPFDYIPKTYNVKGPQDPQYKRFLRQYENQPKKVWIIKPGQNSNRGNGIRLAQTNKVIDMIRKKQRHSNGQTKTYILQSYIQKPFLYNSRKFDIRHYLMLTSVNGIIKAYWYRQGYIRTSSQKYDISDLDNEQIHLTNDAIQKKYDQYEKYEHGNKLSYIEFQRYLDLTYPNKGYNFQKDIVTKMKSIILDVIKANYNIMDKNRRECNFQIFGFDFMVDKEFKPWLIEINFNPCLEINCPVLSRIIPIMVQNSLRIGLDPLLPPMNHYPGNKRFTLSDNFLKNLKYQLIFDELTFEESVPVYHEIQDSDDEEQEYNDDGKQIQDLLI